MQSSKYLFIAMLLLAACSSKVEKQGSDSEAMATFVVEEVQATAELGGTNALYQSIATEKLFNFTACMKDVAVNESIVGEVFEIRGNEGSAFQKTTDSRGCLSWSENIPFNALAKETYIQTERSFRPLRAHKGLQKVTIAFDPWKDGKEALLDLRFKNVPQITDAKSASRSSALNSNLFIKEVATTLEITGAASTSAEANLRISFSPQWQRLNLKGDTIILPLSKGQLRLRYQLVARNNGQAQALTEAQSQDVYFESGLLVKNQTLTLLQKPSRESTLELRLSIEPMDAPEGLRAIQGILSLGKLGNLESTKKSELLDQPYEEVALVANLAEKKDNTIPNASLIGDMDFTIGQVKVEKASVAEVSKSTGRPSKLHVYFVAPLQNAMKDTPILSTKFQITIDGKKISAITDDDRGYLRWDEEIGFNYFENKNFIRRIIGIQSLDPFYGNTEKKIAFTLDPSQYESLESFLIDERFAQVPDMPVGTSEIILSDMRAFFKEMTYEIDSLLSLSAIRKYNVELHPSIRRMTTRGWINEPLGSNGKYLLRVSMESNSPGNPVLDSFTVPVDVVNDVIVKEVKFQFQDLRSIFARNTIKAQLIPADKNSGLTSRIFTGVIELTSPSPFVQLQPTNQALKLGKPSEPKIAAKELFRKGNNMISLSDKERASIALSDADVEALTRNFRVPALLKKFCRVLYQDANALNSCNAKPEKYIGGTMLKHLVKLKKKQEILVDSYGLDLNATVTNTHSNNKDHSESFSTKEDFFLQVKGGTPSVFGFGANVGSSKGWAHFDTNTTSESKQHATAASVNKRRNFVVDEREFRLDVDTVLCTYIFGMKAPLGLKGGVQVCSKNTVPEVVQEQYYFIYSNYSSSPLLDPGMRVEDRPWTFIIRGRSRYENFARYFQDKTATLVLRDGSPVPASVLQEVNNRYDGLFPGVLTLQ